MLRRVLDSRVKDLNSLYHAAKLVVAEQNNTSLSVLQPVTLLLRKQWGEEAVMSPTMIDTVDEIITSDIQELINVLKHPHLTWLSPIESKIKSQQKLVGMFEERIMIEAEKEAEDKKRRSRGFTGGYTGF